METNIGVITYRAPIFNSTNIGDYVQTIAMLGLISKHTKNKLVPGDHEWGVALNRFDKNKNSGDLTRVFPIDRDYSDLVPSTNKPIYTFINGWYMHSRYENNFAISYPDNVTPIFMGLHINNMSVLANPATYNYLKKSEPIGCRDASTARTLLSLGIDAFFLGCPTLTLRNVFSEKDKRSKRYISTYNETSRFGYKRLGYKNILHLDPLMPTRSLDENIDLAYNILENYSSAKKVLTPLLHAYLPCRSFKTNVVFQHNKGKHDLRFEGLIDIAEEQIVSLNKDYDHFISNALSYIENNNSTDDASFRKYWSELCKDKVDNDKELLKIQKNNIFAVKKNIDVNELGLKKLDILDDPSVCYIALAFDNNFAKYAERLMGNLIKKSSKKIYFVLLVRSLEADTKRDLSDFLSTKDIDASIVEMDALNTKGLKLLKHTTQSTMDRMYLPDICPNLNKILYLDIDIAILGDVSKLFDLNIENKYLAGRSSLNPSWKYGVSLLLKECLKNVPSANKQAYLNETLCYEKSLRFSAFNAGVILMNLEKFRTDNFTALSFHMAEQYKLNDQFILNWMVRDEYLELGKEWNYWPTQDLDDAENAKIIHFIGPLKPWVKQHEVLLSEHW